MKKIKVTDLIKVKSKNMEGGREVEDEDEGFLFLKSMYRDGKPFYVSYFKNKKNWFFPIDNKNTIYHKSWLTFIKPKKGKR